ncbi:hypothetical protein KIPB_001104 [Kipferlia bialata]|uniref:Uncharacterized protein n=1 Tax=Kipferlia bialata TaxID=797122 RepID=A0A9K3GDY0_9EUKA|nr:hypothetical protein KIPB_001104 [Kipferlia bialata]|eukprot:g1104.t1
MRPDKKNGDCAHGMNAQYGCRDLTKLASYDPNKPEAWFGNEINMGCGSWRDLFSIVLLTGADPEEKALFYGMPAAAVLAKLVIDRELAELPPASDADAKTPGVWPRNKFAIEASDLVDPNTVTQKNTNIAFHPSWRLLGTDDETVFVLPPALVLYSELVHVRRVHKEADMGRDRDLVAIKRGWLCVNGMLVGSEKTE